MVEVTADTVAGLGSTLTISTSLRVGRRLDRKSGWRLAIPDTIPPGFYRLEVASAANLVDGRGRGFRVLRTAGIRFSETRESSRMFFVRLNEPDENIVLKARLTFSAPPPPPEIPEGEAPSDVPDTGLGDIPFFGDSFLPMAPLPTVSTEEEVGLYIEGTQSIEIQLTVE